MSDQATKLQKAAELLGSTEFRSSLYEYKGAYKPAPHWDKLKDEQKHIIAKFYAEKAHELKELNIAHIHADPATYHNPKQSLINLEQSYQSYMRFISDINQHIKDVEPALLMLEKKRLKSPNPEDENSEASKKIKDVLIKLEIDIQADKKIHYPLSFDTAMENVLGKSSNEVIPEVLMRKVRKEAQEELTEHRDWRKSVDLNINDILPPVQTAAIVQKSQKAKS